MGKTLLLCAFLSIILNSCTKSADGITGPSGRAGVNGLPAEGGRSAITGYIRLKDEFGNPDSGYNQITVSTLMGDSALSVLSDNDGKFTLPNVKSGSYRILLKKADYDSIAYNVVHSGGNEDKFIGDLQMVHSLTSHYIKQDLDLESSPFDPAYNILTITTTVTAPLITNITQRFVHFYFSNQPGVSTDNFLYDMDANSSGVGVDNLISYAGFQGTLINDQTFKNGDTVYMKTYFNPPYSVRTSWLDVNTYNIISYPYIGDSLKNFFIWRN